MSAEPVQRAVYLFGRIFCAIQLQSWLVVMRAFTKFFRAIFLVFGCSAPAMIIRLPTSACTQHRSDQTGYTGVHASHLMNDVANMNLDAVNSLIPVLYDTSKRCTGVAADETGAPDCDTCVWTR